MIRLGFWGIFWYKYKGAQRSSIDDYPEGPTYTTIMELGPQNQNRDGFLGA